MSEKNKKIGELTQGKVMELLDWTYEKIQEGIPGTASAHELASNYLDKHKKDIEKSSKALIRTQNLKAGTSGFLTGLGGMVTLPVAVPVNIASVMYMQMRMVAAIAIMGGYNLKDDQVQTVVYASLAGKAGSDLLAKHGIIISQKVAINAVKKIPGSVLTKINQRVGFRLVTKFGEKGAINLGKMIPLVGGVVGGSFDVATTNVIGSVARKQFLG